MLGLTLDIDELIRIRQNPQTILVEMNGPPGVYVCDQDVTIAVDFLYLQRRH